ncbi:MAG: DUF899 family protein [Phycisphaerales bacterium]
MTMGRAEGTVAQLERDVLDAKKRLAEAIRSLPPEPIGEYTLRHAPSGAGVQLSALFAGGRDLLVVHNMGRRCPYCTLWADGFASMYKHVANRCAMVLTTPDDPAVAGAFASARGWTFPVFSHAGTTFAQDLGYKGQDSTYGPFHPGISALWKDDTGAVFRTGTRPFGPGDDFCTVWPMFELLKGGAGDWAPRFHY